MSNFMGHATYHYTVALENANTSTASCYQLGTVWVMLYRPVHSHVIGVLVVQCISSLSW
jgi:hypothetical protein